MTVKDFAVGQTAYVLDDDLRWGNGKVTAVEVIKVGRRYVTITEDGMREARFCEAVGLMDCLAEDKDYGAKRLLFKKTDAVDEHNELNVLRSWVQEATNWLKVKQYTLAQLRAVKRILEEDGGEKDA